MAGNTEKISIFFLEGLKQELQNLAETKGIKILSRKDLDGIFIFDIAKDVEKNAIHEMVSEIAIQGNELNTGQNSSYHAISENQVSEGTTESELGKTKRYASSHFNSDREAA